MTGLGEFSYIENGHVALASVQNRFCPSGPNSVYILVAANRNLTVKLAGWIKPRSHLNARAPEVIRGLAESSL